MLKRSFTYTYSYPLQGYVFKAKKTKSFFQMIQEFSNPKGDKHDEHYEKLSNPAKWNISYEDNEN